VKYQLAEKHIDIDEQYIRYLEGGVPSTKPILFIHGWAVGREPYQEALNILCQHHQVIAPELPGFGASGSRSNWDYNKYADFLIAFLDKLNISKVALSWAFLRRRNCCHTSSINPKPSRESHIS